MSDQNHQNLNDVHIPHILPLRVYFLVAGSLLLLTILTVFTGKLEIFTGFDPGQPWNIIIALSIAFIKVTLVALFFMHLFYDSGFMRITFFSGLFFLGLFFLFVLIDTETRESEAKPKQVIIIPAITGYNKNGLAEFSEKH